MRRKKRHIPFIYRRYSIKANNNSKLYKILHENRIYADNIREKNDVLILEIPFYYHKNLLKACNDNGFDIKTTGEGDLIKAFRRIIGRPALVIAFLVFGLLILYLKDIVLRIDVITDNEEIKNRVIHVLDEEGVHAGTYIPDIELVNVERTLKQRVSGISWAGISRKGNSLVIDIVETIPKVEGSYSRFPSNLVASENAVIEKITLLDGQLLISNGSGVKKGDIVISGKVETKSSKWVNGKEETKTMVRYTRSMGTVEGTFERTMTFQQKLDDIIKSETGEVYKQRYLHLFSADIPLFIKQRVGNYYTRTKLSCPTVFDTTLPLGIRTVTFNEYDYVPVKYTKEEAFSLAEEKVKKYELNFLKDYEIKDKTEKKTDNDNTVTITVTYKLYGNICEEAAFFIKK